MRKQKQVTSTRVIAFIVKSQANQWTSGKKKGKKEEKKQQRREKDTQKKKKHMTPYTNRSLTKWLKMTNKWPAFAFALTKSFHAAIVRPSIDGLRR